MTVINPSQAGAPAEATVNLPGTNIPIPVGSGIETLQPITPPFRSNAPAWYTPPAADGTQSVWSKMGCAVPQPGRYLQTSNIPLWEITRLAGMQLFEVLWGSDNRKFDNYQGIRDDLYKIHQLLVIGRGRLAAKTAMPNTSPLVPTKAKPSYRMFIVYPVPFYGALGCVNQWLNDCASYIMLMISEAMQSPDNERAYFITKDTHDILYGYISYLIVDMAVKFFGEDPVKAAAPDYVISDALWATFNPLKFSVPAENTSSRPPIGWTPTDLDLEPIRGIPIENVIPFLQPWPDSQLKYSSGGIWAGSAGAGNTIQQAAQPQGAGGVPAGLYTRSGPPNAV